MKVLAIDTSSKTCGVCILEDTQEIYKEDLVTDRSHSIKLMPIIKEVFEKAKLQINDVDLIVCDKGPGSFTGIRIGVATAKAFADSLDKPLIGVNSLETLAYNCDSDLVCPVLDARNDNCYIALFKRENGVYKEVLSPFSASIVDALQLIKVHSSSDTIAFVGDGSESFKENILEVFPGAEFSKNNLLDSYNLGIAGFHKFMDNNMESELPMYLKKPQAERQLEEKLNGNSNS